MWETMQPISLQWKTSFVIRNPVQPLNMKEKRASSSQMGNSATSFQILENVRRVANFCRMARYCSSTRSKMVWNKKAIKLSESNRAPNVDFRSKVMFDMIALVFRTLLFSFSTFQRARPSRTMASLLFRLLQSLSPIRFYRFAPQYLASDGHFAPTNLQCILLSNQGRCWHTDRLNFRILSTQRRVTFVPKPGWPKYPPFDTDGCESGLQTRMKWKCLPFSAWQNGWRLNKSSPRW